jgi:hypothetical protein
VEIRVGVGCGIYGCGGESVTVRLLLQESNNEVCGGDGCCCEG